MFKTLWFHMFWKVDKITLGCATALFSQCQLRLFAKATKENGISENHNKGIKYKKDRPVAIIDNSVYPLLNKN